MTDPTLTPRLCKSCNTEHPARYSHTLKSGNMIYVDADMRQWKGKVCPDCQSKKRKMQRSRSRINNS